MKEDHTVSVIQEDLESSEEDEYSQRQKKSKVSEDELFTGQNELLRVSNLMINDIVVDS